VWIFKYVVLFYIFKLYYLVRSLVDYPLLSIVNLVFSIDLVFTVVDGLGVN